MFQRPGALAGYSKQFAPYPSVGYPIQDFTGTAGPGNVGSGGGNPAQAVNNILPGVAKHHSVVALIGVVVVGYAVWHYAQSRG